MEKGSTIRPAGPDDVPELAEAERECFPDPWSASGIREVLQDETTVALVAEVGGHLAGYLLARTIAGEAEILNLAVRPRHRRRGLGSRLLRAGLSALEERGVVSAFLEVRASNAAAQALYAGFGFRAVGVRRGYYRRPREDAWVLRRDLPSPA